MNENPADPNSLDGMLVRLQVVEQELAKPKSLFVRIKESAGFLALLFSLVIGGFTITNELYFKPRANFAAQEKTAIAQILASRAQLDDLDKLDRRSKEYSRLRRDVDEAFVFYIKHYPRIKDQLEGYVIVAFAQVAFAVKHWDAVRRLSNDWMGTDGKLEPIDRLDFHVVIAKLHYANGKPALGRKHFRKALTLAAEVITDNADYRRHSILDISEDLAANELIRGQCVFVQRAIGTLLTNLKELTEKERKERVKAIKVLLGNCKKLRQDARRAACQFPEDIKTMFDL